MQNFIRFNSKSTVTPVTNDLTITHDRAGEGERWNEFAEWHVAWPVIEPYCRS